MDELRDAIESYEEDDSQENSTIIKRKIVSPMPIQSSNKYTARQTSIENNTNRQSTPAYKQTVPRGAEYSLKALDDEIKKTEVSIKEVNERFVRLKS